MEPTAVTYKVVWQIISALSPLALVLVALLAVRRRRKRGWLLMALGGALQFLTAVAIPLATHMMTLTATRLGAEALKRNTTDTAAVELLGSIIHAAGVVLLLAGIIRLARDKGPKQ